MSGFAAPINYNNVIPSIDFRPSNEISTDQVAHPSMDDDLKNLISEFLAKRTTENLQDSSITVGNPSEIGLSESVPPFYVAPIALGSTFEDPSNFKTPENPFMGNIDGVPEKKKHPKQTEETPKREIENIGNVRYP